MNPSQQARSAATWTVDTVKVGELRGVSRDAVCPGTGTGGAMNMPLIMFVLRCADRTVVVDTGGPTDERVVRNGIPYGYSVAPAERVGASLERVGVPVGDVDLVVNTHLHWDHCSNNELFTNAEIIAQRAELDYAQNPREVHRRAYGFTFVGGPPFTRTMDRIRPVVGFSDVAPGLQVIPLPGHSPGSQGVRVETGTGTYVITGDCVDTFGNWSDGHGTARPSGRFTDLSAFSASLEFLKATGWTPLPSHDQLVAEMSTIGLPRGEGNRPPISPRAQGRDCAIRRAAPSASEKR